MSNGETIVVDVGTTAASLAQALVDRADLTELTVITSGIKIALLLEAAHPRFTVVVTGGTLRPKQHSLVEPLATSMFESLRVDTVFLGCNGVSPDGGVTNINLPEAVVKRAMIASAARCVVLADSTKLGVRALAPGVRSRARSTCWSPMRVPKRRCSMRFGHTESTSSRPDRRTTQQIVRVPDPAETGPHAWAGEQPAPDHRRHQTRST